MTEKELIEKYFNPKNFWGNRTGKILTSYRINRKGQLQHRFTETWRTATWKDFNDSLNKFLEEKKEKQLNNNVNNFNWPNPVSERKCLMSILKELL